MWDRYSNKYNGHRMKKHLLLFIILSGLLCIFLGICFRDSDIAFFFFWIVFLCLYLVLLVKEEARRPFIATVVPILLHILAMFNVFMFFVMIFDEKVVAFFSLIFLTVLYWWAYCYVLRMKAIRENQNVEVDLVTDYESVYPHSIPFEPEPEEEDDPIERPFISPASRWQEPPEIEAAPVVEDIFDINPYEYEETCAEYFRSMGYLDVDTTPKSGDFGADVLARTPTNIKICIQCKQYNENNPVGVKAVQEIFSAKAYYKCDYAYIFTTSYYSQQAIDMAKELGVRLFIYQGGEPEEVE